MKNNWNIIIFLFFWLLSTPSAYAVTISADTAISDNFGSTSDSGIEGSILGGGIQVTSGSNLGFSNAGAFADEDANIYVVGRGGGFVGVATSSTPTEWNSEAAASWSNIYTNSTGLAQDWLFDFHILPLRLGINGTPVLLPIPGMEVGVGVDITLDGISIWNGGISMSGTNGVLTETGNSLGAGTFTFSGQDSLYFTGGISEAVLFSIDPFSNVELKYTMTGYSTGNLVGGEVQFCASPVQILICTSTYGVGDPFATSNNVIENVAQLSSVPIPGTIWLLGSGLLGLFGLARSAI